MDKDMVRLEGVSKMYKRYMKPHHRLVEWLTTGKVKKHEEFWALKNISLSVKQGECLGIVGHNGAGKSTLLKLLSKSLWPTSGSISTEGNVVSLLELGTGFHPELTGIENIFTSGKLLGFSDEYIKQKLPGIIEFSELSSQFLNQPVKSYSSGMYVRLAFSLFANLEPDVYIVDEALSVGDIFFQQKCFDFLRNLKATGTAIILVTHDMQAVKKYCDRVIILEGGEMTREGSPLEMVNLYYTLNKQKSSVNNFVEDGLTNKVREFVRGSNFRIPPQSKANVNSAVGLRRGDGSVTILGAWLTDMHGKEIRIANTQDKIKVEIYAKANRDVPDLTFGYQFSDRHNTVVFGQNSYMVNHTKFSAEAGQVIKATFEIEMNLFQGLYTLLVAATDCQTEATNLTYDWIEGCTTLEILRPDWRSFHGVAYMNTTFELNALSPGNEDISYES